MKSVIDFTIPKMWLKTIAIKNDYIKTFNMYAINFNIN